MKTDSFSDPDVGNTHACTEWEIWTTNPSERIWFAECQPGRNLLSARLAAGVFENSHAGRTGLQLFREYALRVRHRDNTGVETQWSDDAERRFNTMRPLVALIPSGSTWKYRDDSVDQGTAWRATHFSDNAWSSGVAQQPQCLGEVVARAFQPAG